MYMILLDIICLKKIICFSKLYKLIPIILYVLFGRVLKLCKAILTIFVTPSPSKSHVRFFKFSTFVDVKCLTIKYYVVLSPAPLTAHTPSSSNKYAHLKIFIVFAKGIVCPIKGGRSIGEKFNLVIF